jgi:FKBP-type peptidyl-prolyl cis-trans isomerase FkpA
MKTLRSHLSHLSHPTHLSHLSHLVILSLGLFSACGGSTGTPANTATQTTPPPPAAFSQTELAAGSGAQAGPGARVTVKYTGWIYDASKPESKGTKFDSTDDHDPISFTVGKGEVIPGWDQGFTGMRVGGKRRLIIPPSLGYGAEGTPGGPIPPNAGLVFDMELTDVR